MEEPASAGLRMSPMIQVFTGKPANFLTAAVRKLRTFVAIQGVRKQSRGASLQTDIKNMNPVISHYVIRVARKMRKERITSVSLARLRAENLANSGPNSFHTLIPGIQSLFLMETHKQRGISAAIRRVPSLSRSASQPMTT